MVPHGVGAAGAEYTGAVAEGGGGELCGYVIKWRVAWGFHGK